MANTRDPKMLLTSQEKDILTKLDVEISMVGMTFQRQLSSTNMRAVARILLDLKKRDKPRGSCVNFALGDWMNAADTWFGKKTGIQWVQEEAQIKAYRDHLLQLTGVTLIQLQKLEYTINLCCSFLSLRTDRRAIKLNPSDFLSPDRKHRTETLGVLKDALLNTQAFDPNFESRLGSFVKDRNRFIHHFWAEELTKASAVAPTLETLQKIGEFVLRLLKEAAELEKPFLGLFYTIGKEMAERGGWTPNFNESIFAEWTSYEKDFSAILRHPRKDKEGEK